MSQTVFVIRDFTEKTYVTSSKSEADRICDLLGLSFQHQVKECVLDEPFRPHIPKGHKMWRVSFSKKDASVACVSIYSCHEDLELPSMEETEKGWENNRVFVSAPTALDAQLKASEFYEQYLSESGVESTQ